MGNEASKVTTNNAVPGGALAGVELMYGVRDVIRRGRIGVESAYLFLDILGNIL